jgi:hypothetical protein
MGRCIMLNAKFIVKLKGAINFWCWLDSLWKHTSHKKVVIPIANMVARECFLKMNQHVVNECLYVFKGKDFMVQYTKRNFVLSTL